MTKVDSKKMTELCNAILSLKDIEECQTFLTDLCTPAELSSLSDRWLVAQCLDAGTPYREIYQETGVSTATVTRVARALTYGSGGYKTLLERKKKKKGSPNA